MRTMNHLTHAQWTIAHMYNQSALQWPASLAAEGTLALQSVTNPPIECDRLCVCTMTEGDTPPVFTPEQEA